MEHHQGCCGACAGGSCPKKAPNVGLANLLASNRTTCSVDEAAAILGIGRSTAYAAARDGSLPSLRISRRLLVPTAKLLTMLGREAGDRG